MDLLSSSELPHRVRKSARTEYETWRRNDGKEYWASRAISSSISMSAKRTAVGHICKSEHIIKSKLAEDCAADNGMIEGLSEPESELSFMSL
jgi:hypothetical protein